MSTPRNASKQPTCPASNPPYRDLADQGVVVVVAVVLALVVSSAIRKVRRGFLTTEEATRTLPTHSLEEKIFLLAFLEKIPE